MAQVMLSGGKPILVGGKVAMNSACCCTTEPTVPTGACCDAGDCSITTVAGCSGIYQGDETTCDDVDCTKGACCDAGACSITTEADCSGNFLGEGTTCDGVDCTTGACCNGLLCTPGVSGTDCATGGGIYQGDGSTCSDCPCGSCGIAGFMGSGNYYLVQTDHTTRTAHVTPTEFSDGCDLSLDTTTTTTYTLNEDDTCTSLVTCSGSSTFTTRGHDVDATCNWVSDGVGGCHMVKVSGDGSCGSLCVEVCTGCLPGPISDTEESCSCDYDDGMGDTASNTRTVILSSPFSCVAPP